MLEKGHSLNCTGHIGYSKKKQNSIISNIIGAAAFHGSQCVLKWLHSTYASSLDYEFPSQEKKGLGCGSFIRELTGSTPLMLAVIAGDFNIETVKWMIESAKCNPLAIDLFDNSLLHYAVMSNCPDILNYLLTDIKLNPCNRNKEGDTPILTAAKLGHESLHTILSQFSYKSEEKVYSPNEKYRKKKIWTLLKVQKK